MQEKCAVAIQKQSLDEADAFMSEVTFDIDGLPPMRCKAANSKKLLSMHFKRRFSRYANCWHKSCALLPSVSMDIRCDKTLPGSSFLP